MDSTILGLGKQTVQLEFRLKDMKLCVICCMMFILATFLMENG